MSLFQLRNLWSFDLESLRVQLEPSLGRPYCARELIGGGGAGDNNGGPIGEEDEDEDERSQSGCVDQRRRASNASKLSATNGAESETEGSFAVALGKFDAIGAHNVFVCGHLCGFLCLIQVPKSSEANQPATSANQFNEPNKAQETPLDGRQLLAATHLSEPIVDLKCGLFESALRQSVAVLGLNHLRVLQIKSKPAPTDLITGEQVSADKAIDILSHNFDEIYKLDLLADQIAVSLLVLDDGLGSSLVGENMRSGEPKRTNTSAANKSTLSSTVQHTKLPQRDRIVVQYANQFLLTLIEHKKLLGHFKWSTKGCDSPGSAPETSAPNAASNGPETERVRQMSQHVGLMPMAHLRDGRASYLILALSNYRIYCVPVESLLSKARQSILKRVTQSLLANSAQSSKSSSALSDLSTTSGRNTANSAQVCPIAVDLDASTVWHFECLFAPLQIKCISRRGAPASKESPPLVGKFDGAVSDDAAQVLVLSRHSLELISCSGEHIWSQRFETPLTCMCAYTIATTDSNQSPGRNANSPSSKSPIHSSDEMKQYHADSLITVLCTDNTGDSDRSSLIFLKEDLTEWSALVCARPFEIWRLRLSKLSGYLALFDGKHSSLTLSYLGTNADNELDLERDRRGLRPSSGSDSGTLHLLETIDEPLAFGDDDDDDDDDEPVALMSDTNDDQYGNERHLRVECKLEASNQWPQVSVECSVRVQSNLSDVVHNIVAVLQFDDLLRLEPQEPHKVAWSDISTGGAQTQLGSCWPDRREPVSFVVRFSRKKGTVQSPKSLRVGLTLHYQKVRPSGQYIQEEEILLPLTLIGKLEHIDYSSGQSQSLMDVLNNLDPFRYKCPDANLKQSVDSEQSSQLHVCDLFMSSSGDLYMSLLDRVIESDLLSRGRQFDVMGRGARGADGGYGDDGRSENAENLIANTLENVNLLAQSLDCRLKFRSSPSFANQLIRRQTSEELVAPVMFSIGFSVPSFRDTILATSGEHTSNRLSTNDTPLALVWIHICNLSADGSNIAHELIRMHSNEWSVADETRSASTSAQSQKCEHKNNVLFVFESTAPISALYTLAHFVDRLRLDFNLTRLHYMEARERNRLIEATSGYSGDTSSGSVQVASSMVVVNKELMEYADKLKRRLDKVASDYKKLKAEVELEFCKFQLCASKSISLAKRLSNLPDETRSQFGQINEMTRNYCLRLNRQLGELELLESKIKCAAKLPDFVGLLLLHQ